MTCRLVAWAVEAADPPRVATFWAALLGGTARTDGTGGSAVPAVGATGLELRFRPGRHGGGVRHHGHLDLTSRSPDHQEQTVARALALGASHLDVGQRPEERHVVLADPEGNEFCVIGAGNRFLAGTGVVGAIACDGSQQVGYFWRDVLGWPLVWDRDGETAIRAPAGGPILSWGGPPLTPPTGPQRVRLVLAAADGTDPGDETDRLLDLGATRAGSDDSEAALRFTDPDGREFVLVPD